ncbi:hypothetical protein MRX96_005145 [Rhipicephalus microplus]
MARGPGTRAPCGRSVNPERRGQSLSRDGARCGPLLCDTCGGWRDARFPSSADPIHRSTWPPPGQLPASPGIERRNGREPPRNTLFNSIRPALMQASSMILNDVAEELYQSPWWDKNRLSFAVDIRYSSGRARAAHVSLSPKRSARLIYAASVADKALLIKAARSGTCAIRGTRGGVGLARFIGPTRRSDSQSPLSLQRSVVDSFPVIWRPRPGRLAADRQPPGMHATAQHMCRLAYEPRCAVTGLPWKPIVFSECRPFGRWQRTLRPQRAMRERGDGETRKLSWFTQSGDVVLSFS